jgi:DNA-binding PadR family transcriptional regulator
MSLRHAILGLLAKRPASGYDLLGAFNKSLSFVWPAQQSQIYGDLARLADVGWVEAAEAGARGRKEYSITELGRDELRRWLTRTEPERSPRNEPLLRVFFLWTLPPAQRTAYLETYAKEARAYLETLRLIRDTTDWEDTSSDRCARIVLEHGLRITEATAAWADWATTQAHP